MSIFSLLMSSCQGSAEGGHENRNPNQNVRLKPRYKILLNLQSKANLNLKNVTQMLKFVKLFHSNPLNCVFPTFQANLNLFKMNLDRGATYLFPCLFLLFNISYWTFYLIVMPRFQKDYMIEQEN